jgi:hypothetical protein
LLNFALAQGLFPVTCATAANGFPHNHKHPVYQYCSCTKEWIFWYIIDCWSPRTLGYLRIATDCSEAGLGFSSPLLQQGQCGLPLRSLLTCTHHCTEGHLGTRLSPMPGGQPCGCTEWLYNRYNGNIIIM